MNHKCPIVTVILTYWEASGEVLELSYKSLLYCVSVGSYCIESRYPCGTCEREYHSKGDLNRHRKRKHIASVKEKFEPKEQQLAISPTWYEIHMHGQAMFEKHRKITNTITDAPCPEGSSVMRCEWVDGRILVWKGSPPREHLALQMTTQNIRKQDSFSNSFEVFYYNKSKRLTCLP